MENQLLRITTALSEIEQKHYFFGPLIRRLKIKNKDNSISTMGVEFNTFSLEYNNKFVDSLSDYGLEFVLLHEIMHIVNKHQDRFDESVPFMLNNIAGDLEINSLIEKVLHYPRTVPGQYPDMYKFPELQTLETYLELMKDNPEFNQDGSDGGESSQSSNSSSENESGNGGSSDNSEQNQDSEDNDSDKSQSDDNGNDSSQNQSDDQNKDSESDNQNKDGDGESKQNDKNNKNGQSSEGKTNKVDPKDPLKGDISKELKKLEENFSHSEVKQIKEAIEDIRQKLGIGIPGSGIGNEHANEEHEIEEVEECWDLYELAEKISKKYVKINDDFTYRKLSRRDYGNIIMPGRMKTEKKAIKLAIVVDTSGSVHGFINVMASSLKDFQKRFNRKYSHYECDVDIYFTDTQVQAVVPLKKLGKRIPYGGGTSLCSALPVIAKSKKKYNDIIFFTDAEDYSYHGLEQNDPKIYVAITSICENNDKMTVENLRSMDEYHKVIPVILKRYRDA